MQYCFDCDSYNCRCWLEEDNSYIEDTEYAMNQYPEEKANLSALMCEMNVTKDEVASLINSLKDGEIGGGITNCLIGTIAKIRNSVNNGIPSNEYLSLMYCFAIDPKFERVERFVNDKDNHALIARWLEELL